MRAVERLKRDHKILRAKLDVLESALRMGSETWFVMREVCFTLARQLGNHMKREEALITACRKTMNPKVLAEVALEHKDEPAHLRTINRLFVTESGHSLERLGPALTEVIQGLRRHMAEEEAELFPILERTLGMREAEEPAVTEEGRRPMIDETMTVNRIVQKFPRTKPVFDRFFVSIPVEGCTCLDEVAWCHGMDSQELLESLERAIGTRRLSPQSAEHGEVRCDCHAPA